MNFTCFQLIWKQQNKKKGFKHPFYSSVTATAHATSALHSNSNTTTQPCNCSSTEQHKIQEHFSQQQHLVQQHLQQHRLHFRCSWQQQEFRKVFQSFVNLKYEKNVFLILLESLYCTVLRLK